MIGAGDQKAGSKTGDSVWREGNDDPTDRTDDRVGDDGPNAR